MNDVVLRVFLVVLGYLAGSIPVGVIVARISGGPDPRTIGSGRTGGTNALRALGRKWAALVVAGDLAKGALPVLLTRVLTGGDSLAEVLVAAACVAGAVRSIFLGFTGGRGVGTGVGTMLVIQPVAVVLAAPVFFLVIVATRYVSLGSLLGSAAMFPATLLIWAVASGWVPPAYIAWAVIGPILIWLAHADNIERLLHGTERKFDLALLGGGARVGPREDAQPPAAPDDAKTDRCARFGYPRSPRRDRPIGRETQQGDRGCPCTWMSMTCPA